MNSVSLVLCVLFVLVAAVRGYFVCSKMRKLQRYQICLSSMSDPEDTSKESTNPPPGRGEWDDWDVFVDDDTYPKDDDEEVVPFGLSGGFFSEMNSFDKVQLGRNLTSSLLDKVSEKLSAVKEVENAKETISSDDDIPRRSSTQTDWSGCSEEAPYFDENDVQDDEGNWGRKDETEDESANSMFTNNGSNKKDSSKSNNADVSSISSSIISRQAGWERFYGGDSNSNSVTRGEVIVVKPPATSTPSSSTPKEASTPSVATSSSSGSSSAPSDSATSFQRILERLEQLETRLSSIQLHQSQSSIQTPPPQQIIIHSSPASSDSNNNMQGMNNNSNNIQYLWMILVLTFQLIIIVKL